MYKCKICRQKSKPKEPSCRLYEERTNQDTGIKEITGQIDVCDSCYNKYKPIR